MKNLRLNLLPTAIRTDLYPQARQTRFRCAEPLGLPLQALEVTTINLDPTKPLTRSVYVCSNNYGKSRPK